MTVDTLTEQHQPALPVEREFITHVTGGLDGAVRVAMLLRGRNYRVRDLAIDVREGVVFSEVRATVVVTAAEAELLLKRLWRLPAVVSAGQLS
jgi:hypothetical protein